MKMFSEHHAGVSPRSKQDVLNQTDDLGRSALMIACSWDSEEVVMYLLTQGANPNQTSSNGRTPLMLAVLHSRRSIVEALLSHGADVNAADGWCETALMHAATLGRVEVVKLLLAQGADANVRNRKGKNASDLATDNGHSFCAGLISDQSAATHDKTDLESFGKIGTAAAPLQSTQATETPKFSHAGKLFNQFPSFWQKTYIHMYAKARESSKVTDSIGPRSFMSALRTSGLDDAVLEHVITMVFGEQENLDTHWGRFTYAIGLRLIALAQQGRILDPDVAMNPDIPLYPMLEGFPADPLVKGPRLRSSIEDFKFSEMSVEDVIALFESYGAEPESLEALREYNVDGPTLQKVDKNTFEAKWNLPDWLWRKLRGLRDQKQTHPLISEEERKKSLALVPSKRQRDDSDASGDEEEISEEERSDDESSGDEDVGSGDGGEAIRIDDIDSDLDSEHDEDYTIDRKQ